MEVFSFSMIVGLVKELGVPGLVLVIWFFSYKSQCKTLARYHDDMLEQRRMYDNNVKLCENYLLLAQDQREIIVMNTRGFTKLVDNIKLNQFCPMVRLKKKTPGVVEE